MKKKRIQKLLIALTFIGLSAFISGCNKDTDTSPLPTETTTITDVVVNGTNFSTLEAAVIKADLQTTLSGDGPFTVFAPDDNAFTASGITDLSSLSAQQLKDILLYHTIGTKIPSANVPAGPNAKVITASGDSVFVTKNSNGVFVNGIQVTTADVSADNGVIHVINRVLLPPSGNTVQTAANSGLDSLVKAVTTATMAAGGDPSLANTLSTATLTVFAPTNAAFTQLLSDLSLTDIDDIPIGTLVSVLKYHVVSGRAFSSDLSNGQLMMLNGNTTVSLAGTPTITGNGNAGNASNITATNIVTRNGVVHLIDRVLLP